MKTFKVFKHPALGFQALKVGFSVPAFFFVFVWAFAKKLWGHGFGILGICIFLRILQYRFDMERNDAASVLVALIGLCFAVFIGFKGNKWRAANLQKRGFELVETLQSETPDAAIGKAAKT